MKYPNIAAEKARNGFTWETLANELGVCRKTLFNWVNQGKIPKTALIKMSQIFNCSIDYLLN